MSGGHGIKGGDAEVVKFGQVEFPAGVVDLVDHQKKGPAGGAEVLNHLGVPGLGPLFAVHDQQNDVGVGHRGLGLAGDLAAQLILAAYQAPGIHQEKGALPPGDLAQVTVPGNSGHIRHQGLG